MPGGSPLSSSRSLASLGVLVPVYFLTESLFDRRIAFIAAGVLALLPRVAEVGHETLADSLGLFATFMALWLAAQALTTGDWRFAIGSGLVRRTRLPGQARGHPGAGRHRADLARRSLMPATGPHGPLLWSRPR